jgi:hypothetical protein
MRAAFHRAHVPLGVACVLFLSRRSRRFLLLFPARCGRRTLFVYSGF